MSAGLLEPLLIIFVRTGLGGLTVTHHESPLQMNSRLDLLQHGQKDFIHDQEAVLGVVHDVSNLIRVKTKIQRMENSASGGNPEIRFEMDRVVPHQGGYTLSALQAGCAKAFRQPPRALIKVAERVAV